MKNKGFTLIELLVVIAIIGILSSVVLASLTTARTRGQAASVQSQLSNMRAQAELFYSTNSNTYGTFTEGDCTTAAGSSLFNSTNSNNLGALMAGVSGVVTAAKTSCAAGGTTWAAAALDPSVSAGTQAFCVDSTGVSKTLTLTTANAIDDAITSSVACAN
jgi:prepilin-type N-terminal cleavage/methylation domain-containing protein